MVPITWRPSVLILTGHKASMLGHTNTDILKVYCRQSWGQEDDEEMSNGLLLLHSQAAHRQSCSLSDGKIKLSSTSTLAAPAALKMQEVVAREGCVGV